METGDRVTHRFTKIYGTGKIVDVVNDHIFVVWDNGGSSMEPSSNLEIIEEN